MDRYEIIKLKLSGWSNSKISKEFKVSRGTIRKYWNDYQNNLDNLNKSSNDINDKREAIEAIVKKPRYDGSKRLPRKYTEELDCALKKILKEEDLKHKD